MLRSARQQQTAIATKRSWNLVVFSVGGLTLAARTEDVGGVAPWGEGIPVPSRTPFVVSLLKRDKEIFPVYDLASRLHRKLKDDARLCLVVRHPDGPMAIGIDADIPTLQTLDAARIRPSRREDVNTLGSFEDGGKDIDIVALRQLGKD